MKIAALVFTAAAATLLLYSPTLGYGFDYDDYHFIRPYSRAELLAAFHGPWDATGIEVRFYRPLTVAWYAVRFELFGLNSYAHHAVSLGLVTAGAALAGALAWRISGAFAAGLVATLFFVVHPAIPYSLAAWVTNQMHGIEALVVLSACLWWHSIRRRPFVWWVPLLAFGTAAFLIKEDGVMLLPCLMVLHECTRRIRRDTSPCVPLPFVISSIVLLVVLGAARAQFLQGLGGYGRPSPGVAWRNLLKGLISVFALWPPDRPWQRLASVLAIMLPLGALALWRRTDAGARALFAAGASIALLFNLPFMFISKAEQLHLVALGAALVLAASVLAWARALRAAAIRVGVSFLAAVALAAFALVSRNIATDFEPSGPIVRYHDRLVTGWMAVPEELRGYLERKLAAGDGSYVPPNPADAVDSVAFNLHLPEISPAGVRLRWMSAAEADIYVRQSAREVVIPLRHEIGAFREPAHATIHADGRLVDDLTLRDDEWHMVRVGLRSADVSSLRRMHRLRVSVNRVWRPQALIPGSRDTRTLGVQLGEIQVR